MSDSSNSIQIDLERVLLAILGRQKWNHVSMHADAREFFVAIVPSGGRRDRRTLMIAEQRIDQRLTFQNTNHRRMQLAVVLITISNSQKWQRRCIRLDPALKLAIARKQDLCLEQRRLQPVLSGTREIAAKNGDYLLTLEEICDRMHLSLVLRC